MQYAHSQKVSNLLLANKPEALNRVDIRDKRCFTDSGLGPVSHYLDQGEKEWQQVEYGF